MESSQIKRKEGRWKANKGKTSAEREQEIKRRERYCSPPNKHSQENARMCGRGSEGESKTRRVGLKGRIEGGLLSVSSDRREADPR